MLKSNHFRKLLLQYTRIAYNDDDKIALMLLEFLVCTK